MNLTDLFFDATQKANSESLSLLQYRMEQLGLPLVAKLLCNQKLSYQASNLFTDQITWEHQDEAVWRGRWRNVPLELRNVEIDGCLRPLLQVTDQTLAEEFSLRELLVWDSSEKKFEPVAGDFSVAEVWPELRRSGSLAADDGAEQACSAIGPDLAFQVMGRTLNPASLQIALLGRPQLGDKVYMELQFEDRWKLPIDLSLENLLRLRKVVTWVGRGKSLPLGLRELASQFGVHTPRHALVEFELPAAIKLACRIRIVARPLNNVEELACNEPFRVPFKVAGPGAYYVDLPKKSLGGSTNPSPNCSFVLLTAEQRNAVAMKVIGESIRRSLEAGGEGDQHEVNSQAALKLFERVGAMPSEELNAVPEKDPVELDRYRSVVLKNEKTNQLRQRIGEIGGRRGDGSHEAAKTTTRDASKGQEADALSDRIDTDCVESEVARRRIRISMHDIEFADAEAGEFVHEIMERLDEPVNQSKKASLLERAKNLVREQCKSERHFKLALLYLLEGYAITEAAEALGMKPEGAKAAIRRLKQRLHWNTRGRFR